MRLFLVLGIVSRIGLLNVLFLCPLWVLLPINVAGLLIWVGVFLLMKFICGVIPKVGVISVCGLVLSPT
jgi:hypothetical protein